MDERVESEGGTREKAKTSINIDKGTWTEWIKFVVNRTGSARKMSEELEKALQEYMEKHR